MANQDRWRNYDDRSQGDDGIGRDWRERGNFGGEPRNQSTSSYGDGSSSGRANSGYGGDDYGRGGEYRNRNDYDYGGSNFSRPDRNRPSNLYGSGPGEGDHERGRYRSDASGSRSQGSGRQDYSRDRGYEQRGGHGGGGFGEAGDRGASGWDRGDERYGGGGSFGRQTGFGQDYSSDYGSGPRSARSYGGGFADHGRGAYVSPDERGQQDRGFWDRASDEVSSWFGNEGAERRRQQDQFRGRGPKGYSRSDDRIREDVSDRLSDDPSVDASEVEVEVKGAEVTLTGTVPSREHRRRAEDVAEHVSGVSYVQNNLRVKNQAGWAGSSSNAAGSSHATGSNHASSIGQTAFGRDTSSGTTTTGTSSAASTAGADPGKRTGAVS